MRISDWSSDVCSSDLHPWRFGREFLQMEARAFIAAMLGPHDRENAEFDKVRLAPERGEDALIFFRRQAVFGDDFGGDGGRLLSHGGIGRASCRERGCQYG